MNITQKAELFLEMFNGRTDVYGKRWDSADGKRGYSPACDNFFKPPCHIKLKDGITCSECEHKAYTPISSDTIMKHIRGEESHHIYILKQDGTITYGAVDFDYKEGKESRGYKFEDAQLVSRALSERGISHAIARSTGNGHHLYVFFDKPTDPSKFRAVMLAVFEEVGFMELVRQGIKTMPELFPKQVLNSSLITLGNALTPPMNEAAFVRERNCFVDENGNFIQDQWGHLSKLKRDRNKPEILDKVIKEEEIEIHEISNSGNTSRNQVSGSIGQITIGKRRKWNPPIAGSMEKMVMGCRALRDLKLKCDKIKKNEILGSIGHDEGFALYHLAMHTIDGLEWFEKNVPGWGQSQKDIQQLQQSLNKNYSPRTCADLQAKGVCLPGTKCFDKKAPIDRIDGLEVERTDLPEAQWPEPSPIRYAFGKGGDYLRSLMDEVDNLKLEKNAEIISYKLASIIKRSTVFDQSQQDSLKQHIVDSKLSKARETQNVFRMANKEREKEVKEIAKKRGDIIDTGEMMFKKTDPFGFSTVKEGIMGGGAILTTLCHFDLIINEVKTVIESEGQSQTKFVLKATTQSEEKNFSVDMGQWADNKKLSEALFVNMDSMLGTFNIQRINELRICVTGYSTPIKKTLSYGVQGWFGDTYLMPDVIIDAESVKPNTSKPVEISSKQYASNINFKILNDDEFKDVMLHIKTDLFNAFPRNHMFATIGHAMMAGIFAKLGIKRKPTLFIEGLTGSGKTQMCLLAQHFYGSFPGVLNLNTSYVAFNNYAHDFKDAFLLGDDYKEIDPAQKKNVLKIIQYSYDDSMRGTATVTGAHRGDKHSRAFLNMTGEVVPENEASVIGRMLLLEYPQVDNSKTVKQFNSCMDHKDLYQGVTPRFIQWFLNQDTRQIRDRIGDYRQKLQQPITGKNNADRISENCAINYLGWELFVQFMEFNGIISHAEATEYLGSQWKFLQEVRDSMQVRCSGEQMGNVAIERLADAIESRAYHINGSTTYGPFQNSKGIGFMDNGELYLIPNSVLRLITEYGGSQMLVNKKSITEQWTHSGALIVDKNGNTGVQKRPPGGENGRYWHFNPSFLKLQKSL